MATKAAAANGMFKENSGYLTRIEKYLREIKAIRKEIERERAEGRKVSARIRQQHKQIQSILNRVEATL